MAPLTLPETLRAHRLTGTVTYADGTPAAGATVVLSDAAREWMDVAEPIDTDPSGIFSFVVHEGLSYTVAAWAPLPSTRGARPITTDVGPFVVTKEPAPLHLVVTPTR